MHIPQQFHFYKKFPFTVQILKETLQICIFHCSFIFTKNTRIQMLKENLQICIFRCSFIFTINIRIETLVENLQICIFRCSFIFTLNTCMQILQCRRKVANMNIPLQFHIYIKYMYADTIVQKKSCKYEYSAVISYLQ